MKRQKICKWMYLLIGIEIAVWAWQLCMDYADYSVTLNSAPFRIWVLARSVQCLLFMIYPVAMILYQKKKIKEEEEKL